MKVGDLIRNIKSGQYVVFLGKAKDCYHFWHHEFKDCHFSIKNWKAEHWEIVDECR